MLRDAGRDPARFGVEGRMTLSQMQEGDWAKEMEGWRAMRGITHLCVNTMGLGLKKPDDHVQLLRRFRATVGLK